VTARRGLRAAWASLPVLARVAVFTAARACGGAGGGRQACFCCPCCACHYRLCCCASCALACMSTQSA
jgi:hypothetical protein